MQRLVPTPEITLGPFFPPRYVDAGANDLTMCEGRAAKGEAISIEGRVVQEDGSPTHNLVLELWQADANGIYRHPADPRSAQADPDFFGWGRAATDREGRYGFRTIRPGAPAGRAPHVNVIVLFSGIMRQLHTVMFFDPENEAAAAANAADPLLLAVPEPRRGLLVAKRDGPGRYRFDLRLRGEGETPFFDFG